MDTIAIDVTVSAVNDPPSFTKGLDQFVAEDCGAQSVEGWATDISAGADNESDQTLTFKINNNTNAALFSAGPAVSNAGVLSYTPADNANGTATLDISLSDSGGASSGLYTVTITVEPVNDPPVNTSVPLITGIARIGEILRASSGSWNDDADGANAALLTYSYQWQSAEIVDGEWKKHRIRR